MGVYRMTAEEVLKEIEIVLQDDNDDKLERIEEIVYHYEYNRYYNAD